MTNVYSPVITNTSKKQHSTKYIFYIYCILYRERENGIHERTSLSYLCKNNVIRKRFK